MPTTMDAITANKFAITIDGETIASFSELQGITTSMSVVDFIESSEKEIVQKKLPGRTEPPTITLKRGKTNDMALWTWHELALRGDMGVARRSCSLVMFDASGKPTARYHLENAWPNRIEISPLRAGANEVLTESVTLVCEHIQRVAP